MRAGPRGAGAVGAPSGCHGNRAGKSPARRRGEGPGAIRNRLRAGRGAAENKRERSERGGRVGGSGEEKRGEAEGDGG